MAPATATPTSGEASEAPSGLFGRSPPGNNAIVVRATFPIPDFGLALGYDRAVHRRFTVGGEFEYSLPTPGYSHLAGFSETINGRVWLGRALHGVFGELSLTAAHQVLTDVPELSRTTLAPGAAFGFRHTRPIGLSFGASAGLRWAGTVNREPLLCTHGQYCPATRTGPVTRITADIGWVF